MKVTSSRAFLPKITYVSSILVWEIPWAEKPGGLHIVHGVAKSWTQLRDFNSLTQYSILWIYHILFIHLCIDSCLNYFCFSALMNNAAMKSMYKLLC